MKTILVAISFIVLCVTACRSSKKTTAVNPVAVTPVPVTSTATKVTEPAPVPTSTFTSLKTGGWFYTNPASTVTYPPGHEELTAIQLQYKDVTAEQLKEGYVLYAEGACISCHGALNIYSYNETQWKTIIDDMATRAAISDMQKDAVYKYVLAVKATQTK